MFETALFDHIKNNFTLSGFTLVLGFKSVPETTKAPYVIQYPLDTSGDAQFLCNDNDFSDGEAFIQWNVSHPDPKKAFYIKCQLMTFIAELKDITGYQIMLNTAASSPGDYDETSKLYIETVTREITYSKK